MCVMEMRREILGGGRGEGEIFRSRFIARIIGRYSPLKFVPTACARRNSFVRAAIADIARAC